MVHYLDRLTIALCTTTENNAMPSVQHHKHQDNSSERLESVNRASQLQQIYYLIEKIARLL